MKSLSRKIFACLLVFMLGFNLAAPIANAIAQCADHACCCRSNMTMAHHGHGSITISAANGCCSSSGKMPCNLNRMFETQAQVFTLSNTREVLQKNNTGLAGCSADDPPFLQASSKNHTSSPSRVTTDPIPLYLQNLTLIC
ncbi:hypothetical protein ACFL0O_08620 [Thermodesulfobacteriota bacterium]